MRFFLPIRIACILVGCLGGVLVTLAPSSSLPLPLSVLLGGIYGLLFALLLRPSHAAHAGAGLLWGLGYALLLWLAVPTGLMPLLHNVAEMGMLDIARTHFSELIAYLLFFGAPLGLIVGLWNTWRLPNTTMHFTITRALIVGGLAGLVGGWAFSTWFAQNNAFMSLLQVLLVPILQR